MNRLRLHRFYWLLIIITVIPGCVDQSEVIVPTPVINPLPIQIPTLPSYQINNPIPLSPFNDPVASLSDLVSILTAQVGGGAVSVDYPAVLNIETAGMGIDNIERVIYQEEEGEKTVLSREKVNRRSNLGDSSGWPDGINEFSDIWSPEAYYLTNGTDGAFVTAHRNLSEDSIHIAGKYRLGPRDLYQDVFLAYEGAGEQPSMMYARESGLEIQTTADADFQAWNTYLSPQGKFEEKAVIDLSFDDSKRLVLEQRPLPAGEYASVYIVQTGKTQILSEPIILSVELGQYSPDMKMIVRPESGFQIAIPQSWPEPAWSEGSLITVDPLGKTRLSISVHHGIGLNGPENLGSVVLQNFGPVKVLYQDQAESGGWSAFRTVYAYEALDGAHTGIFLSMVRDGVGYVIDLDSSQRSESELLALADSIIDSWRFRERPSAKINGNWVMVGGEDINYFAPIEFIHEQLKNGWHRSASIDGTLFFAIRTEPNDGEPLGDLLEYWRDVASQEANGFHSSLIYEYKIGELTWQRIDFEYINSGGQRYSGFIAGSAGADRKWFFWSEAPSHEFHSIFSKIYKKAMQSLNRPRVEGG